MKVIAIFGLMAVLLVGPLLTGCGDNPTTTCFFGGVNVSPATATADHSAIAPGNSQQFLASGTNLPSGCAAAAANLRDVIWSVSDTTNVNISNIQDSTFGVATCVGATAGPATVTATLTANQNSGHQVSGTATLTCN